MRLRMVLLSGSVAVLVLAGGAYVTAKLWQRGTAPVAIQEQRLLEQASTPRSDTDRAIATLHSRLTRGAPEPGTLAQLGLAYLQRARETADPADYGRAEQVLTQALALSPEHPEALQGMGTLALARHQFEDARTWGQRAVTAAPARAAGYGIIGDALVELGRYDEAVSTVQQMVDLRPDLASYARVSHLRELHGDIPGAIDAMERAVRAGAPASEHTAYVRVLLAGLLGQAERIAEAEHQYRAALAVIPGYAPALGGLARLAAAAGNDTEAERQLLQAVATFPTAEHLVALGELYLRAGRPVEAERQFGLARAVLRLYQDSGMDTDIERARLEADHGDAAAAVTLAQRGYQRRPSIHAAGVLAWALFRAGRTEEARPYIEEALRLGSRDPVLRAHAAAIRGERATNAVPGM